MRELIKVKEDLNEIRYYYSLKELFDIGAQVVSPSVLEEKVQLYNRAVSNAPAQLYAYYIAYYVKNNKQIALASEWCCSTDHLKDLNNKLHRYFQQVLD